MPDNTQKSICNTMPTKQCACGKLMIKRSTGHILSTHPPQFPMQWWCGGCGKTENSETIKSRREDAIIYEQWEKAQ